MNDKELDKLFREKLEHHAIPPKKNIWDQIQTELDAKKVMPIRKRNWISYAAIVIGCLGIAALLYNILQPTTTPNVRSAVQKEAQTVPTDAIEKLPESKRSEIPSKTEYTADPQLATTKTDVKKRPIREQKESIQEGQEETPGTDERTLELVALKPAELSPLYTDTLWHEETLKQHAVEAPPIAPLIDYPETEESMLASAQKTAKEFIPGILNKLSDVLKGGEDARIQISKDEEGFLRLDVVNSLVKNRNKKRR